MNLLWVHHFVNENDEISNKIWSEYLSNCSNMMFQYILRKGRKEKDETLIHKLITQVKRTAITDGARGVVYSCLIDIYSAKGQYEQALMAIEMAISDVRLENINRTALERVKIGIESANGVFPFRIPERSTIKCSADEEVEKYVLQ